MNTEKQSPPDIITLRLRLRRFTTDDASFARQLLNEPSFLEFIGDRGVRTHDDAVRYIEQGPIASYRAHGHGLLCMTLHDGTPVGMCGLLRRPGLDLPDLGFALLPAHWARGLVVEASRAVIAHGREALGLDALLAITSPHNVRSMRVLEKLGFRLVEQRAITEGAAPVNVFRLD